MNRSLKEEMSRPFRNLGEDGLRQIEELRLSEALADLQGITKKSVWPEWVRERRTGDGVKEHPRFNRPEKTMLKHFKYKIHANVFLASAGAPYFPNTQAKR